MAQFSYTALDSKDVFLRGTIQARNHRAAEATLTGDGLSVITLRQDKKKTWLDVELNRGLGMQERILITRHLHTMLEAGIAIDEALKTIAEQSTSDRVKKMLLDLHLRVQKGQPLHQALGQHGAFFPPLYINLVRVGEVTGKLDSVLAHLLEQQEKELALRTKVFNAMLYPSIILTALILMVSLMLVFVIPRVATILGSYDVQLPLQTRILVAMSDFLSSFWYIVFPLLIFLVYLFRVFIKRPTGKRWWDSFILAIPGIKILVQEVNLARITRTLHATLQSGLSIDQALELTASIARHDKYHHAIQRAVKLVRRGAPLGEILHGYPSLYPPIATRMISVGEKTGKLDHMLGRLADYYESNVQTKLTNLSSIIEPMLILVIGLVVGYVAISVMTPIWSFSQTI